MALRRGMALRRRRAAAAAKAPQEAKAKRPRGRPYKFHQATGGDAGTQEKTVEV